MKYIIFQDQTFAIIPETACHKSIESHNYYEYNRPIAAGFCMMESYRNQSDDIRFKVSCWGESETLKLKSRGKKDADIIANGLK